MSAVKESGATYRLPTADEWDYACRAEATGDYCKLTDGTEITRGTLGEGAWYSNDSHYGMTHHRVGKKKPNAFGLDDMLGNVWEWTSTVVGRRRVNCGGSWKCDDCPFPNNSFLTYIQHLWHNTIVVWHGLPRCKCASLKAD